MRITKTLGSLGSNTVDGHIEQALRSLKPVGAGGVDGGAFGRLLQYCTDHQLPRQAKQLHARIVSSSVVPDNFLASKLITFYARSNRLREARKVFDEIPGKNIFSWNALLIGYTLQSRFADALRLFSSLVFSCSGDARPDFYTISCILKALSSSFCDTKLAREGHCFVLRSGFDSDIFVANALVTFYTRCDEAGLARIVFDRMPERDIVSWNSMIAGYSQCGYYKECKELYREMLKLGVRPNGVTVVSVLQACGQSQDLIFGMEVHKFVIDHQVEVDISLYNALIGCYAKCGSLDYARELFEEMDEKDEVTYGAIVSGYMVHGFVDKAMGIFQGMKCPGLSTWNAVLSGLVQNNHHEEVLDLFRQMLDSGTRPNTVTLSSILPTCSFFSYLKGGKEIHAYSLKRSYDQNTYISTAIIDTYAKSGFLAGAQLVFDHLKNRSLIVWTAIISAYAAHGDATTALSLFNTMQTRRIQPDPVTITAVLSACSHNGLVDEAWKIFNEMLPNYGIQPLVEHYACMVGVLSRAKRLSEAAEFIRMMPIQPSAKVWGALLNGASVSGDIELGEFACDHLFEIEPENTGNYVIMANLYSQAGRWEEADRVRGMMKNIGLKKIAGNSWIEIDRGLRSFIASDASSDKHEEIYEVLEGLLGPSREEGYVYKEEMDEESL